MGITSRKGDVGHAMVMADLLRKGYKVALPFGDDWPFDLIVYRDGKLERVQCKFAASNGEVVEVRCRSCNNWMTYSYTADMVDWIAVYDQTTDKCYYVPAQMLGGGRTLIHLRLVPTRNNQKQRLLWADRFLDLDPTAVYPDWCRTEQEIEYESFDEVS